MIPPRNQRILKVMYLLKRYCTIVEPTFPETHNIKLTFGPSMISEL